MAYLPDPVGGRRSVSNPTGINRSPLETGRVSSCPRSQARKPLGRKGQRVRTPARRRRLERTGEFGSYVSAVTPGRAEVRRLRPEGPCLLTSGSWPRAPALGELQVARGLRPTHLLRRDCSTWLGLQRHFPDRSERALRCGSSRVLDGPASRRKRASRESLRRRSLLAGAGASSVPAGTLAYRARSGSVGVEG
jgi:hypothetical protein